MQLNPKVQLLQIYPTQPRPALFIQTPQVFFFQQRPIDIFPPIHTTTKHKNPTRNKIYHPTTNPRIVKETIKPNIKYNCFLSISHCSWTLSVPVVNRLVRTLNRHANVVSLVLGELGEPSPKLAKVKCSNLLIKVLRQNINLLLILPGCLLLP